MVEYTLKAVSQIVFQELQTGTKQQFIKNGKILSPPTYDTVLPNNKTQQFEHDATTIIDEKTSEKERILWRRYLADTKELGVAINQKLFNYIFFEGVDCEVSEDWKNKMKWLGVELPDNDFDIKVKFVSSEIAKTPEDIMTLFTEVMKLSARGVDQQLIDNAEATFRGSLPKKEQTD